MTAVTLLYSSTKGMNFEEGDGWVNTPSGSHEEKVIKDLLKKVNGGESVHLPRDREELAGVSEENDDGRASPLALQEAGKLLVPSFNVNDTATKSKFSTIFTAAGTRWSMGSIARST